MASHPLWLTLMLPAIRLLLIKLPFCGQKSLPLIIDKNLLLMFGIIGGKCFFILHCVFNINVFFYQDLLGRQDEDKPGGGVLSSRPTLILLFPSKNTPLVAFLETLWGDKGSIQARRSRSKDG